jgi:16S rRNA (adenine1518-N6/adenine1519-N6)-dimethyltransferase
VTGEQAAVRLLGAADVRELAARLGVSPAKRLGQNFVIDPATIRRIVRLAGVQPDDVVLEVGPGLGSLTLGLVEHARLVVALEVDPVLAAELPRTAVARAGLLARRLVVRQADALAVTELPCAPADALVANLPYNIAVPVLLHVLEAMPTVQRILVMVQSEVADRLCAPPGSRVYGVPSVKLAWYGTARRVGTVARSVFWPVPNVGSALVAFRRDALYPVPPGITRADVFAVVDAAFAQRRKTLRTALAGWAGSAAASERVLRSAGIDPGLRGESLGIGDYIQIAAAAGAPRTIVES